MLRTVGVGSAQYTRIHRATDGTRPPSTRKSRYQPKGATVLSGGAFTSIDVGPTVVITQPMKRCDWLNPWVTAPGRSSTTSAIDAAFGVSTVNVAP